MKRCLALVLALVFLTGCGTYRITYRLPSKEAQAEKYPLRKKHSHGIGLVGGGGYFFALHQMFPALIDYTGERSVPGHCPNGVYEVSHYHDFGQNTVAALISWLVLVNVWHQSNVEWSCLKDPSPATDAPIPPTPESSGTSEAFRG